jgi:altronate dehydratase
MLTILVQTVPASELEIGVKPMKTVMSEPSRTQPGGVGIAESPSSVGNLLGGLAQMVKRSLCMRQAAGSMPASSGHHVRVLAG